MKQIYKITYPTGKIYIGKDSVGSYRYFGSPNMHVINDDFASLSESVRQDYTIRKQILWESADCSEAQLSAKEVEFIRKFRSNDPEVGYNRWPKFNSQAPDMIIEVNPMKEHSVQVTQVVSDITCDVCGQSVVNEAHKNNMANLDNFVEYTRLVAEFGYGSKRDGEKFQFDFCEDCFDALLGKINELKAVKNAK